MNLKEVHFKKNFHNPVSAYVCVLHQIFRLESERAQWEQRYLEETAMRQVAIDAASIPKDAKIASLEKSSAESERVIAEARVERMKQLEEVDNSKVSEGI